MQHSLLASVSTFAAGLASQQPVGQHASLQPVSQQPLAQHAGGHGQQSGGQQSQQAPGVAEPDVNRRKVKTEDSRWFMVFVPRGGTLLMSRRVGTRAEGGENPE